MVHRRHTRTSVTHFSTTTMDFVPEQAERATGAMPGSEAVALGTIELSEMDVGSNRAGA